MARVFLCFAAFFFVSSGAVAVNLEYFETKGAAFVRMSGKIEAGDSEKVISSLAAAAERQTDNRKIIGLALDSHGGSVIEAVRISEYVETAKTPVVVTQQASCESACFFIFMSSPAKFVAHGARVGVHSVSLNGKENADTSLMTVRIARLARSAGVPQSVIGKMVTADPEEMHYLSDNELKQMSVSFLDDDDNPAQTRPVPPSPAVAQPAPLAPQAPAATPQPSGSVTYNAPGTPRPLAPQPETDVLEQQRRAEIKAAQDQNFARYWSQILGWSKAQHGGTLASERRCNKSNCATVVAYFDRQQRYVEAWRYDEPPQGSGVKLVCRQTPDAPRLSCKDWYDEREFSIDYTHQIGEDRVSSGADLLDFLK
ncbi:MAG: hypothetical protein CTY15_01200 [Methylocystis sp.]|nr:MAG: hypothetical protein CTY15_01200 [Methylocystis sp.]